MAQKRKNSIVFKGLKYNKDGNCYLFCLDINIVVRGRTFDEAKEKLQDAVLSYFDTFTDEEMCKGKYIRRASMVLYIKYYLGLVLHKLFGNLKTSDHLPLDNATPVEYDPASRNVKFA